ncbi:MAG: tRNA uridine-5-carboxymethylaminomethyl(34) synthesis GTPase MnmE [Nitrospirae bacterium]|nr:tRNA uridine-5-carboxymethylaminomethyl(34) synthesis GTPase MnmE [Nitrospirota bacterium]MBF0535428.1 tRNA uridine-5-carboxymethylaminomethyl(34) synthesis GTPase MnmE [Nitrospirota bacterium]MBF0617616.1 tRNA uridine-5-carboxymethylaminomethyl(34) synthesis GTPase MnmE [Nitrospirota bacterium]
MNSYQDTIAAVSTPPGEGGIGIVRISGKDAIVISQGMFKSKKYKLPSTMPAFTMSLGHVINPHDGSSVDEVLITVMRAPHSYTAEDVVEFHCHGGYFTVKKTLEITLSLGARLAEPGEFTLRAFLNGRIDLSQAEGVLDVIKSKTAESSRIALEQLSGGVSEKITEIVSALTLACALIEAHIDFSDEDAQLSDVKEILKNIGEIEKKLKQLSSTYETGRLYREGMSIAIVGRTNVGKSSLLNALLEKNRAIVSETPGTTRDTIEEYLNIDGIPARVIDTAGIRQSTEYAELEGIKRSLSSIEAADVVVAVFDGGAELTPEDFYIIEKTTGKTLIALINKSDLKAAFHASVLAESYGSGGLTPVLRISAKTNEGIGALKDMIFSIVAGNSPEVKNGVLITNVRHKRALDECLFALARAATLLSDSMPLELVAFELRTALNTISEITGVVTTDSILDSIFGRFCIGK